MEVRGEGGEDSPGTGWLGRRIANPVGGGDPLGQSASVGGIMGVAEGEGSLLELLFPWIHHASTL